MNIAKNKNRLPESAITLLLYLENNGKKTQKEIITELKLPIRSVRYAIRRLIEEGVVTKQPNLFDMRSVYYSISDDIRDVDAIIAEHKKLVQA